MNKFPWPESKRRLGVSMYFLRVKVSIQSLLAESEALKPAMMVLTSVNKVSQYSYTD
jgi:hypothetical protein